MYVCACKWKRSLGWRLLETTGWLFRYSVIKVHRERCCWKLHRSLFLFGSQEIKSVQSKTPPRSEWACVHNKTGVAQIATPYLFFITARPVCQVRIVPHHPFSAGNPDIFSDKIRLCFLFRQNTTRFPIWQGCSEQAAGSEKFPLVEEKIKGSRVSSATIQRSCRRCPLLGLTVLVNISIHSPYLAVSRRHYYCTVGARKNQ